MTKTTPSSRLISIDVLRGVAVLAVVVAHLPFSMSALGAEAANGTIYPPQPFPSLAEYGRLGVQLFLLISGFCIHMRWARTADPDLRVEFLPFWKRRLMRLYPPYFIALTGAVCATFVFHSILGAPQAGLGGAFGYASTTTFLVDIALLVFMLQNLTPAPWRVSNGPFWSLALEEQLYLLYFPLLWMRRHWGWARTFAVCGSATILWRLLGAFFFETTPFFWFLVGPAFWLPWALGAYAVEAHFGHQKLPAWASSWLTALALFALGLWCDPPPHSDFVQTPLGRVLNDLFFSGAFFVMINAVVQRERDGRLGDNRVIRALTQFGVWSYSIYLVHLLAMVPAKQLAVRLGLPNVLTLGVRLAAGLVVGYVFYRLFEVPFHRIAQRVKAGLVRVKERR